MQKVAKLPSPRGAGRPPGSTGDVTRARILSAARTCFGSYGFAGTSNRDIADRAGLTPAALYQYFDSKLALYAAAARDAVDEISTHLRKHVVNGDDTSATLREVVMSLLSIHDRDPTLTPFFAAMGFEAQRNPEIDRAIQPDRDAIISVMFEFVRPGVARGDIAESDVLRAVLMFVGCTLGLAQFAGVLDRPTLAVTVSAYADLLDGTLFRKPARPAKRSLLSARKTAKRKSAPARVRR